MHQYYGRYVCGTCLTAHTGMCMCIWVYVCIFVCVYGFMCVYVYVAENSFCSLLDSPRCVLLLLYVMLRCSEYV